jgi:arylsulfatase
MDTDARPNIFLIFTDQQRWDTLSAYGNKEIQTPNIDKIASEGVTFENAITPCPLCLPARTCTMTGYPAGRLGTLENRHPDNLDSNDTIAGYLKKVGYYCQAIGKMHFSNIPYQESYGMDNMILSEETRGIRLASGTYVLDDYDRFLIKKHAWGWDKPPEIGYNEIKPVINYLKKSDNVTQWCGDQTVNWLHNKRPKSQPFFLWTSFVKPHPPFDCPEHLQDLYRGKIPFTPWISGMEEKSSNLYLHDYREENEFILYSEEAKLRAKENYYANITFIDEQIGRIVDTLESEGIAHNTVIIFASDHGELLGDHLLWFKKFGYEGSIHIPLIIKWYGHLGKQIRCSKQVSLLDLFPTIMDIARVPFTTGNRPGSSLLRTLTQTADVETIGVSEILYPPHYMLHVRTNSWKYLYYQNGGYEELYNLKKDPHELQNIAVCPEYNAVKKMLVNKAVDWIQKYDNPDYVCDCDGRLKKTEYVPASFSVSSRPFSRMPWDSRIPAGYLENGPFFSSEDKCDWSFFLHL